MSEKRLTPISPLSAFTHAALVSLLLAYPAVALMRFFQYFDPQRASLTSPWWMVWALLPIGFALAGATARCSPRLPTTLLRESSVVCGTTHRRQKRESAR